MALIDKASLLMVPSVYEDGTLYNVLPSGNKAPDETGSHNGYDQTRADFTFSRGFNLAATRVNASGLIEKGRENLLTQSNNFSHSDWNVKAGTFTQGVADPDGGNNAWAWEATNTDPYLYQSPKTTNGVSVLSIWVKGVGSTIGASFQIRTGAAPYKNLTLTGEWQRVEHYNTNTSGTSVGFEYGNPAVVGDVVHIYQAQYEVGTIATAYMDSGATTATAGVLENTPRIDYSSGAGALLLEPSRSNLITNSEYFGAGWSLLSGGSFTFNQTTSPEGVKNASTLSADGVNANAAYFSASVTSGTAYAFSIYAKQNGQSLFRMRGFSPAAGGNVIFDLSDGTINTQPSDDFSDAKIEAIGTDGWYRCSVIATADATNAGALFGFDYSENTASGGLFYVWGAQFEASASYASSYVPTHGAAVTRGAEGFADLTLNYGTSFTMMFDIDGLGGSHSNNFILRMGTTNPIYLSIRNNDRKLQWYSAVSGVGYFATPATKKIAISCDGTSWIWASDGATGTLTATASCDFTYMRVATDGTSGGGLPSGLMNQLYVSDEALSASELATLTTL